MGDVVHLRRRYVPFPAGQPVERLDLVREALTSVLAEDDAPRTDITLGDDQAAWSYARGFFRAALFPVDGDPLGERGCAWADRALGHFDNLIWFDDLRLTEVATIACCAAELLRLIGNWESGVTERSLSRSLCKTARKSTRDTRLWRVIDRHGGLEAAETFIWGRG